MRTRGQPENRQRREAGQALVESALVMPLMVFVILGVVQLTVLQHARIMTEYAAFNAARAGIVWNGDPWVMENAAIISLMPTYGALAEEMGMTDPARFLNSLVRRALLYQVNRRLHGFARLLIGAPLANALGQAFGGQGPQIVTVHVENPTRPYFLTAKELDFDDVASSMTDYRGMWLRVGNRLTIRVRYLYVMRIPFANWVIHHAWLSHRAGIQLYGAIWNPQGEEPFATGFSADSSRASYRDIERRLGPRVAEAQLYQDVARAGRYGVYMVPLTATYSMRAQSNFFARHFWSINAF